MGMKANSGYFSKTSGAFKHSLDIQFFGLKQKYKSVDAFAKDHENFSKYKPITVYKWLSDKYGVKPLSKGTYKGVKFVKGGGFKLVYGKDKLFQYHPKGGHHKLPYYKVSSGKGGTHRYYINGKEF